MEKELKYEPAIRFRVGIPFIKDFLNAHAWKYLLTSEDVNVILAKLQNMDRANQFSFMDIASAVHKVSGHKSADTRFKFCEVVYTDLLKISKARVQNIHLGSESAPESPDSHVGYEGHRI